MRYSGNETGEQLPISAKIPSSFQLFCKFILPSLAKDNSRLYSIHWVVGSFYLRLDTPEYKMHSLPNFFQFLKTFEPISSSVDYGSLTK